jgi:hypothetical protein
LDNSVRRGLGDQVCRDCAAVAEDRDPVADLEDFIEVMGHENDCDAVCPDPGDKFEETLGFPFRQRGGRFVEDQNLAFGLQCPRDFNKLPVGDAKGAHGSFDIDISQPDGVQRLAGASELSSCRSRSPNRLRGNFSIEMFSAIDKCSRRLNS